MTADPFGTVALRRAVLDLWESQPDRFREDANSEEDHSRGYYRDRVVVELAQNAADAATRAGVVGRLRLTLATGPDGSGTLRATNTGSPLDAEGLASMASLRASAKRSQAGGTPVGRFGVGFAAVRSVADEITVASSTGTVHFSLARTASLLEAAGPALATEVVRRHGSLPALRLPFAGPGDHTPGGADAVTPAAGVTTVTLHLRDSVAVESVRTQLRAVGDPLLLALPWLGEVEVGLGGDVRVVRDVAARWVVASRSGTLDERLLLDRPVEERQRSGWQVTWAVPRGGEARDRIGPVVHAPTPTDEPMTLPALLVATFPLDPSRRHVASGAVTQALVERAGQVWADLLTACRDDGDRDSPRGSPSPAPHPLDLIPSGLPAGALDAALRESVLAASREVPLLAPADGGPARRAGDAAVLAGPAGDRTAAVALLGAWMPDLVTVAPWHRTAARLLGVVEVELADVVDALPELDPTRLRDLYDAFDDADPATLEQLATLPVPLADGRKVRGCRGLVLLDGALDPEVLRTVGGWGVRAVHPAAAHPLLERLGAERADAAGLLRHPVVRSRVLSQDEADDDEALRVTDVVLGLVEALQRSGAGPEPEPWWGEVLLPAQDGELVPARGLVLPGSPASRWFDPEVLPPVAASVLERWGGVLEVLGVRAGLTVVRVGADELVSDVLDGWEDYLEDHGLDPEGLDQQGREADDLADLDLAAVADLDAVLDDAWPEVLAGLAQGEARRALVTPVPTGGGGSVPSYTAWWLRRVGGLGLDRPFAVDQGHRPGAELAGLLGPTPRVLAGLDVEVQRALGGVGDVTGLGSEEWADLLTALPAAGEPVDLAVAVLVWQGLTGLVVVGDVGRVIEAELLPALDADGRVRMLPVDDVAVAPSPMWAQHRGASPLLVVAGSVAEQVALALDLPLADERADGAVTSGGQVVATPPVVRSVFPGAPATWVEHEDLLVDGDRVDWWVVTAQDGPAGSDAVVHAATTAGLAHGLAQVVGWEHRGSVLTLLADADARHDVLIALAADVPRA
ncbi:sacsin N-terminal ATP-binding-like domain-containing protein [Actinotalea sp. K2]|uniref:sacsin N-terminal ATP-binding-like domain-containing protein n=1 Tax=Actinotalea sp. K2 TaxID=2939438 RepID=UPI0020170160|nr:ATP-binding protein [Actinotalea sp. K2]MCL3861533.1 ATP-binding protein [Actinotalea sp. K2]